MISRIAQKASEETQELRRKLARAKVKRKERLKWWLVYGPPRTGTSYMDRLIKTCATLHVSDWGLAPILEPIPAWLEMRSPPVFDYIRFDQDRYLADLSRNILDNAYLGDGSQLDFVYKQATLSPAEFTTITMIWGPPEHSIFCIREPAGYMASARKKFIYGSVETLQQVYIDSIANYQHIGGDIFEYTPELSVSDYTSFLQPLNFAGKWLPPFQFKGEHDHENTTEAMWDAYHRIKELAAS